MGMAQKVILISFCKILMEIDDFVGKFHNGQVVCVSLFRSSSLSYSISNLREVPLK